MFLHICIFKGQCPAVSSTIAMYVKKVPQNFVELFLNVLVHAINSLGFLNEF